MVLLINYVQGIGGVITLLLIAYAYWTLFPYSAKKMVYGAHRVKQVFFIDSREMLIVVLDKESPTFTRRDGVFEYVWSTKHEKNSIVCYTFECAEPIDPNFDLSKSDFYCMSDEYAVVSNNKIARQWQVGKGLKELDLLKYLSIASIVFSFYIIMQLSKLNEYVHTLPKV